MELISEKIFESSAKQVSIKLGFERSQHRIKS